MRTLRHLPLAAGLLVPAVALAGGGHGGDGLSLVSAIGLAIIAASIMLVVFNALRLPALLAYIVSGLVMATVASPWFGDSIEIMGHIAHLGLVFLLFIIGIEMDLRGILRLGPRTGLAVFLQAPVAIAAVLGLQYAAGALGYSIVGLGADSRAYLFFAVACALGSTAVVVKLLGDKFDLSSKAGKITVLTLIAEDIWAVLALSYVASTSGGQSTSLLLMLGGGVAATGALFLFSRYVLSPIMNSLAKAPDLMALLAIGWCFLCAEALSRVGLSAEMGALIAGLTVGALPSHVEILAKVSSLRDFFMAIFFVALGMTLPIPTWDVMIEAGALVGIAILARLLLFTPALLFSRLGPMVSLAAAINLSQISEFTLLLVPLGIASGALTVEQGSVISYGLMLSVIVSSFTIAHNYQLAQLLGRLLPARDEADGAEDDASAHGPAADVVMLGFFVNAEALATELERSHPELIPRILVIDYNLQNHKAISEHGFQVVYGDISNPETLRHHGLTQAKVVLSTISNTFLRGTSNEELADEVRGINPQARFIATADDQRSADAFRSHGVFRTVIPAAHAAPVIAQALRDALDSDT